MKNIEYRANYISNEIISVLNLMESLRNENVEKYTDLITPLKMLINIYDDLTSNNLKQEDFNFFSTMSSRISQELIDLEPKMRELLISKDVDSFTNLVYVYGHLIKINESLMIRIKIKN